MKTKGRPSVLDVARMSGVSPSTVCRVINGRSNVSERSREDVMRACSSLGFKKNAAASLLRLRKSNVVAALMPDNSNEMFIDKIEHLKRAVIALGHRWRLHSYHGKEEADGLLGEIVAGRPCAAILGCPLDEDARRLLDSNGIPVILYDQPEDPVYDSVSLDRAAGICEAVSYVLGRGRRKMLAFGFSMESERGEGCLRAFENAGLPRSSIQVHYPPWTRDLFKYGYDAVDRMLDDFDFDFIMAMNDACAIGIVRRLLERGFKIPDEIPVLGFDDIMVSSFTSPSISTVAQPKELMADAAADFLAKRLASPSLPRQSVRLSTRFVKRESA